MRKKRIEKYILKQIRELDNILVDVKASRNSKAIHQFRLIIKKLNAIFRFIGHLNSEFEGKKKVKFIYQIYKYLGGIRDFQIQLRNLENYSDIHRCYFPEFYTFIKRESEKVVKDFDNLIDSEKKIKPKKIIKHFQFTLVQFTDSQLRTFIAEFTERSIDTVHEMLQAIENEENIHEIRRIIKDVLYIIQFSKFDSNYTIGTTGIKSSHLNEFGILLGDWHDLVVLRDSLFKFNVEQEFFLLESNTDYQQLLDNILEDMEKLLYAFRQQFTNVYKQNSEIC